jgi:hypothetical protein
MTAVCALLAVGHSAWSQSKSKTIPRDPPDTSPQYFPEGVFHDSSDGKGGYNAGNLTLNESHDLTKAQVEEFFRLLRRASFWSAPAEDGTGGADGARWVLEGVENGRYHIVDRWSPTKSDFEDACVFLFEQSKIRLEPKEIY